MTKATFESQGRTSVGVRELKNQLSAYLDRVQAGEEVTVTQHGKPIARLSAVEAEVDTRQELIEAGIILPASSKTRRLPKETVRLAGGESVADIVAKQRR